MIPAKWEIDVLVFNRATTRVDRCSNTNVKEQVAQLSRRLAEEYRSTIWYVVRAQIKEPK